MTFKSLFGQFTILSLNLVITGSLVSMFSHLTHETFKLRLQNTLNMLKTTRVYFGVLHFGYVSRHVLISSSALLLVLRDFDYMIRHVMISASALMLVLRHFYYVSIHILISASALLLVLWHIYYVSRHVLISASALLQVLHNFHAFIGLAVSQAWAAVSPRSRARPCTLPASYRRVSPGRVASISRHNPAAKPRACHDTPIRIAIQSLSNQALAQAPLALARGPAVSQPSLAVSWPLLTVSQGRIVVVPCLSKRALARLFHDTIYCIVTQNREWAVAHPAAFDQVFFFFFSLSYYWKTSYIYIYIYIYIFFFFFFNYQ